MSDVTPAPAEHFHIAIIGGGFSGIATAVRLKQRGTHDFAIFERAEEFGGTWRANTYPGCACDVPSNLYSLSFAPNPSWSRSYSPQQEIWDYVLGIARRHQLHEHGRFGHEVQRVEWDERARHWSIATSRGNYTADIVIAAQGPLSEPHKPQLPGLDRFEGEIFHSAEWNHDYDLTDKRVAVVGTGASAIQFVPAIQPQVRSLTLFQRTPAWVLSRLDRPLSRFEHELYRRIPLAQKLVRGLIYSALELRVIPFVYSQRLMKFIEIAGRLHMRRSIKDRALRRKLTPSYRAGCKRILLSNDYYPALAQPNAEVVTDGIREIRERSVVDGTGNEHAADAIILGTGFVVTDSPHYAAVFGRDGHSMAEVFAGSPQAYKGTTVSGFPNYFMLWGPNCVLGHTSVLYMIESQIAYLIDCLDYMERTGTRVVDVRREALEAFNRWVQDATRETVWTTGGCDSYYLDANGLNTTMWPGFTFKFREMTRRFDAGAYELDAAPASPARAAASATK